jgi:histone H3/H4
MSNQEDEQPADNDSYNELGMNEILIEGEDDVFRNVQIGLEGEYRDLLIDYWQNLVDNIQSLNENLLILQNLEFVNYFNNVSTNIIESDNESEEENDESLQTSIKLPMTGKNAVNYEVYQQLTQILKNEDDSFQQMKKVVINKKSEDYDPFRNSKLPLARIKKLMKMDEKLKMISAEAPILFSKICEIFIQEVTLRAWTIVDFHKRRTVQKQDILEALKKSDMYDFLIDLINNEA